MPSVGILAAVKQNSLVELIRVVRCDYLYIFYFHRMIFMPVSTSLGYVVV